jgi:hypothetical protein
VFGSCFGFGAASGSGLGLDSGFGFVIVLQTRLPILWYVLTAPDGKVATTLSTWPPMF